MTLARSRRQTTNGLLVAGGLLAFCMAGCGVEEETEVASEETEASQAAATVWDVYNALKAFEAQNPYEGPANETVDLGYFYATRSCAARGAQPSFCFPQGGKWSSTYVGGRLLWDKQARRVAVRGRSVSLKIRVSGASTMTAVVNGRTYTGSTVTIPLGAAPSVTNIRLSAGSAVDDEVIQLQQGPFVGAGAFTIPVLPLGVVYEPPQRPGFNPSDLWHVQHQRNYQSYTQSTTVGSSIEHTAGSTRSTTTYEPPSSIGNKLTTISNAYEAVGGGGAVGSALKGLASGFGTVSGTQTQGVTDLTGRGFSVATTISSTTTTNSGLGPGKGDLLFYMKNVKVAWFWSGSGSPRLTVLGHDGVISLPAQQIKDHVNVLQQTTPGHKDLMGLRSLMALDPFIAGGANAPLAGPRFEYIGIFTPGGQTNDFLERTVVARWNTTGTERLSVQTEDHHAGWLSSIGIGETSNYTGSLSFTYGTHRSVKTTVEQSALLHLFGTATDKYQVLAYHDHVSNTFAVKAVPTGATCVGCTNN